jgi:phage-related baseplate assembly protein
MDIEITTDQKLNRALALVDVMDAVDREDHAVYVLLEPGKPPKVKPIGRDEQENEAFRLRLKEAVTGDSNAAPQPVAAETTASAA